MSLIEFEVDKVEQLPTKINWKKIKEQERIKYDLPFKILINGEMYFYDEYFTILDFLYVIWKWKNNGGCGDMLYNSIDTDENPLICFKYNVQGWSIESPWERFKCEKYILKKELFGALEILEEKCNVK